MTDTRKVSLFTHDVICSSVQSGWWESLGDSWDNTVHNNTTIMIMYDAFFSVNSNVNTLKRQMMDHYLVQNIAGSTCGSEEALKPHMSRIIRGWIQREKASWKRGCYTVSTECVFFPENWRWYCTSLFSVRRRRLANSSLRAGIFTVSDSVSFWGMIPLLVIFLMCLNA